MASSGLPSQPCLMKPKGIIGPVPIICPVYGKNTMNFPFIPHQIPIQSHSTPHEFRQFPQKKSPFFPWQIGQYIVPILVPIPKRHFREALCGAGVGTSLRPSLGGSGALGRLRRLGRERPGRLGDLRGRCSVTLTVTGTVAGTTQPGFEKAGCVCHRMKMNEEFEICLRPCFNEELSLGKKTEVDY